MWRGKRGIAAVATRDLIAEAGGDPVRRDPVRRNPVQQDPAPSGQPESSLSRSDLARPDLVRPGPEGDSPERTSPAPFHAPARIARAPVAWPDVSADTASAKSEATAAACRPPCWIALHFPALPLLVCDFPEGLPGVVIHESGGRQLVHAACPLASDLGVAPGMPLNAAHVLCRNLVVRRRDPLAEYRWLKRAGEALHRFTPAVSLGLWRTASETARGRKTPVRAVTGPADNADSLLMEVAGSLRLFGGLEALLDRLRERFAAGSGPAGPDPAGPGPVERGTREYPPPLLAVAPAPTAALLLARNGREEVIRDPAELRARLGDIPLSGADIEAGLVADLGRCGLGTLRDLWRLPPADLGRRFGSALPDYLGRLAGERPEAAARMEPVPRFRRRITLPADTRDSGMILLAAEKLLAEACRFLDRHAAAAEEVLFELWHVDRGRGERRRTRLPVATARAGFRAGHFLPQLETLLEARLTAPARPAARPCGTGGRATGSRRVAMPEAVEAVSLRIDRALPRGQDSQDLFERRQDDQPDWDGLVDLLTARLGREGVCRLQLVADHRPERAACPSWAGEKPGDVATASLRQDLSPRPLWLLAEPRPLTRREAIHPAADRPPETERIEAGWWERADMRRDYLTAGIGGDARGNGPRDDGPRGWLFRDLRAAAGGDGAGRWYLHGLFG